MAPEKSPAFQFYPKEFLMDGKVAAMSLQERGAYITLICICWQEKSLPSDLQRLANIVGLPVRPFQKLWPSLSSCFVQQGDRLLHPRLEKEREKQADFTRRQSDKGIASAAARASRKVTDKQPEGNRGSTQPQPDTQPKPNSPSLRSPISDLRKECTPLPPRRDLEWEQFKTAYPSHRRQGGYMAEQGFLAACEKVGFPALLQALERHKRSEDWQKGFVPSLERWFEKELWIQTPDTVAETQEDSLQASLAHLHELDRRKAERS